MTQSTQRAVVLAAASIVAAAFTETPGNRCRLAAALA